MKCKLTSILKSLRVVRSKRSHSDLPNQKQRYHRRKNTQQHKPNLCVLQDFCTLIIKMAFGIKNFAVQFMAVSNVIRSNARFIAFVALLCRQMQRNIRVTIKGNHQCAIIYVINPYTDIDSYQQFTAVWFKCQIVDTTSE